MTPKHNWDILPEGTNVTRGKELHEYKTNADCAEVCSRILGEHHMLVAYFRHHAG